MSFLEKVTSIWQEDEKHYVHGWVRSDDSEDAGGVHYLQVRCTDASLRLARDNAAPRKLLLQSLVTWPNRAVKIPIAQTIDKSKLPTGGTGDTSFQILAFESPALTEALPLNGGDIDVAVALLAVPESGLFDRAAAFLNDVASLTMVPQLTAAAPIAEKIATGIDGLLGNDEIQGKMALIASIPTEQPKVGHLLVTDLTTEQASLEHFYVQDKQLRRWDAGTQQWESPSGFGYILLQILPYGSLPERWKGLPAIADPCEEALEDLTRARTEQDVRDAWPKMHQAIIAAGFSPDLAEVDRKLAAAAMADKWKEEAQRLADAVGMTATETRKALAPPAPAVAETAQALGLELEATVQRIVVGQITVQTDGEVEGEVIAARIVPDASVQAGDISVTTKGSVGPGGSVKGLDIG